MSSNAEIANRIWNTTEAVERRLLQLSTTPVTQMDLLNIPAAQDRLAASIDFKQLDKASEEAEDLVSAIGPDGTVVVLNEAIAAGELQSRVAQLLASVSHLRRGKR